MSIRTMLLVPVISLQFLAGCGDSAEKGSGVTEWLGEETHLAVSGTVQGITFDHELVGDQASSVYCNRFYAPMPGATQDAEGNYDGSEVYFAMKEIGGVIDIEGEPKEFTIAYWRHDLGGGTELEVVPREFGASIPAGKTWSDINLFTPGENLLSGVETAALTGVVKIELNAGAPAASGTMLPSGGRTGEFVSISWGPRESLNVSATAECTTRVVEWATELVAR